MNCCRRFTNALALMVWVSVAWTAYEMYTKVTDRFDERWRTRWLGADFWHALSFAFLAVMCWLFRPAVATMRYSYSEPDGAGLPRDTCAAEDACSWLQPALMSSLFSYL